MKNLLFMSLLAALTLGAYACGDDDSEDTPVQKENTQDKNGDSQNNDNQKENNGDSKGNNNDGKDNGNDDSEDPDFVLKMPSRTIYYADDEYMFVYLEGIDHSKVSVKVVDESGNEVETSISNNGRQYHVKTPAQVGTFHMEATTAKGKVVKSSEFCCIPIDFTSISTEMDAPYIDLENGVAMNLSEALANPSKVTLVVDDTAGLVSPSVCGNESIRANGNSIDIEGEATLGDTGYTKQFKLSNGKEGLITFLFISYNSNNRIFSVSFNYSFK